MLIGSTAVHTPTEPKCAFILHGLNTNPKRMSDLSKLAEELHFRSVPGILSGHLPEPKDNETISAETWMTEFAQQWSQAMASCNSPTAERIFIAYSLGALTGMNTFDGNSSLPAPTKMILVSPALQLRKKTMLIRALSQLPFGSLPSVNHPDYRARTMTPLKAYRALFALNDEWQKNAWTKTKNIPTLLALATEDELVDSQKLADSLTRRGIIQWKIEWINNQDSTLSPRYHHLIIDEKSQGINQWKKFKLAFNEFLENQDKKNEPEETK